MRLMQPTASWQLLSSHSRVIGAAGESTRNATGNIAVCFVPVSLLSCVCIRALDLARPTTPQFADELGLESLLPCTALSCRALCALDRYGFKIARVLLPCRPPHPPT